MLIPMGFLAASGAAPVAAYELISTNLITNNTTGEINFTSIPQTYKHLQLRVSVRSTFTGANSSTMYVDWVGTVAGYYRHRLLGNGSTVASANSTGVSQYDAGLPIMLPGFNSTANTFSAAVIDILDYTSTTKTKTGRALFGYNSSDNRIGLSSASHASTAAITSLKILLDTQNFVNGSRLSLYGIKGA